MKFNQWTLGLAALGVISLASAAQAEEAQHQVMTALSSTTLSGYVNTSAIWQFGKGNTLVGRSYDGAGKQDGFNLDVVKLQLEKPLDEGQWAAGYTLGLLFGPDANTLATTSSAGGNTSDFALKDANVTLRAPLGNGLDLKMGVWESPIGYEVFDGGSNPNYSRSFGYALEPRVFTGLLASYRFSDSVSVAAGVADPGGANMINSRNSVESLKTYLAAVTLRAPESMGVLKDATLYFGVVDRAAEDLVPAAPPVPAFRADNKDVVNLYAGVYMPTPVTGLSVGLAYDYRANGVANSSYETSIAGYLSYQATEKLKLSDRIEYAGGTTGAWGVVAGASEKNVRLFSNTLTADYALWGNAITRAELRWDHSLTGQGLFNDGSDRNALSVALNLIYKF